VEANKECVTQPRKGRGHGTRVKAVSSDSIEPLLSIDVTIGLCDMQVRWYSFRKHAIVNRGIGGTK